MVRGNGQGRQGESRMVGRDRPNRRESKRGGCGPHRRTERGYRGSARDKERLGERKGVGKRAGPRDGGGGA